MSLLKTYSSVSLKQWAFLCCFWTFFAVIISGQLYSNSLKNGFDPSWINLFMVQLPIWYLWMFASPLMLYMVNKYPLIQEKWISRAFRYFLFGIALVLVLSNLTLIYMFSVYGYLNLSTVTFSEYAPYLFSRFTNDFLIFVLVQLTLVVVHSYSKHKNNQLNLALERLKNNQLKSQLTQAQLQALKLQLNPHFLFNTLNTISSLTLIGEKTTSVNVTSKLGDFLRRTLDFEEYQLVSVEKELEFFDLYMDIEKSRFKDRIELIKIIDADCLSLRIPNLILQPVIENAIKYGIAKSSEASLIKLEIFANNSRIYISLFNEGPFLKDENIEEGTGISNVRSRLSKLYGEDFLFNIQNHSTLEGVITKIEMPLLSTLEAVNE